MFRGVDWCGQIEESHLFEAFSCAFFWPQYPGMMHYWFYPEGSAFRFSLTQCKKVLFLYSLTLTLRSYHQCIHHSGPCQHAQPRQQAPDTPAKIPPSSPQYGEHRDFCQWRTDLVPGTAPEGKNWECGWGHYGGERCSGAHVGFQPEPQEQVAVDGWSLLMCFRS